MRRATSYEHALSESPTIAGQGMPDPRPALLLSSPNVDAPERSKHSCGADQVLANLEDVSRSPNNLLCDVGQDRETAGYLIESRAAPCERVAVKDKYSHGHRFRHPRQLVVLKTEMLPVAREDRVDLGRGRLPAAVGDGTQ